MIKIMIISIIIIVIIISDNRVDSYLRYNIVRGKSYAARSVPKLIRVLSAWQTRWASSSLTK